MIREISRSISVRRPAGPNRTPCEIDDKREGEENPYQATIFARMRVMPKRAIHEKKRAASRVSGAKRGAALAALSFRHPSDGQSIA